MAITEGTPKFEWKLLGDFHTFFQANKKMSPFSKTQDATSGVS
jgi:hypothetical protein